MARSAIERGEATRQRILDAARTIAEERGYKGTTLALIQKHAGVHPGSLYWFFEDKDTLFASLVEEVYRASQRQNPDAQGTADLPNPVKAVLDRIVGNPARYGLWRFNVQFMLDPDLVDSKTAQVIRALRADSQNAMTRVWLDSLPPCVVEAVPDLARRLAEHALVVVEGCILARVAGRPVDEDEVTRSATAMLDAMVERSCAQAGVAVPGPIRDRTAARASGD